jgi:hypothetical protein
MKNLKREANLCTKITKQFRDTSSSLAPLSPPHGWRKIGIEKQDKNNKLLENYSEEENAISISLLLSPPSASCSIPEMLLIH